METPSPVSGPRGRRVTLTSSQAVDGPSGADDIDSLGDPGAADDLPDLRTHLLREHGLSVEEYRRNVLQRTIAEWPQPIPAQVLRTRLRAFKDELSDRNFRMLSCACCAREKRRCKLSRVDFPSASAPEPPAWMMCSSVQWRTSSKRWLEAMHSVFDIDAYLDRFFEADVRVADAEKECLRSSSSSDGASAAASWSRRVLTWRANLRADLVADSISLAR